MADENIKLAKFQAAVFAEVDFKAAEIKQRAELLREQELERNKDVQLEKSYNYIQAKSSDIQKKYKREVATFGLQKKRELLLKRQEIADRVFNNVTDMLVHFTTTPEYKEYLLSSIKKFADGSDLKSVEIHLNEKDLSFKTEIEKLFKGSVTVLKSDDVVIGGFIASNSELGLYFDETIEQRLADQRTFFMQNSQLAI